MAEQLDLIIDDGGRSKYFKASGVGDCGTRAFAIATGMDYKEAYNLLKQKLGYSPRNGILHKDRHIFTKMGYQWVSCMGLGTGIQKHLAKGEVPMKGSIICNLSKHYVAVVDGVVHDTYDSRRDGTRGVYGYWIVK